MKKILCIALILTSTLVYSQIPNYVPTAGLNGWWPFCGNANDLSSNANNGTVNGATLDYDRFGNSNSAYQFDGVSGYINTNYTGILGANSRAVSFWAKTTNNTSAMAAVSWGDSQFYPNTGKKFGCEFNYATSGLTIDGADCAITYQAPGSYADNLWHHYVFQMDSGALLNQVYIYMDGVLATTPLQNLRPTSTMQTINYFNVLFGKMDYSLPYFFQGSMDDIAIWNRVLTTNEITALYNGNAVCTKEGINEQTQQTNIFSIYPNPTNTTLNINLNKQSVELLDKTITLKILSVDGKLVKTETINKSTLSQYIVDTSSLANGLYYLNISSGDYSQNMKFVKE